MSGILRWYYSVDNISTLRELTDRIDWPTIEVGGKANQDAWVGDLIVDDPDGDFIPLMFRRVFCVDDDGPTGYTVVGNWFISNLKVQRKGNTPVGSSRTWTITMADENSLLSRKKFVGTDTDRPEETDIDRIRWMLGSAELSTLDPNEDYIDTSSPVTLDAANVGGQSADEILTSITGRTGKQSWVMYREDLTPHSYTLWYANQNRSDLYSSTISLSNVLSEVGDPTSTLVYPLSSDAELDRAGGRMASGLLGPWKQKTEYVEDTDLGDAYGHIDRIAADLYNVTTEASAIAQITRQLKELSIPDDEITTIWTVESDNLNLIRHGMRLQVHASHFPNYTDDTDDTLPGYLKPGYADGYVWCRVMERTVRQVGPTTFEVPLKLAPMPTCEESQVWLGSNVRDPSVPWTSVNTFYFEDDPGVPVTPGPGNLEPVGPGYSTQIYSGVQMNGSGTVDIYYRLNSGGVFFPDDSHIHFEVLLNGVAIFAESALVHEDTGTGAYTAESTGTLTDVAVEDGDIVRATYQFLNDSALNVYGFAPGMPLLRVMGCVTGDA